jgi:hypothetical protein
VEGGFQAVEIHHVKVEFLAMKIHLMIGGSIPQKYSFLA